MNAFLFISMTRPIIVRVAVEAAAPAVYSYAAPPSLAAFIAVGQAVLVPLGKQETAGYVLELAETADIDVTRLRPISSILVSEPLFGPSLSRLISFISTYYLYPPGLCAKEILPGGLAPKMEKTVSLTPAGLGGGPEELIGDTAELAIRLREAHPAAVPLKELEKEGFGAALKKMTASDRIAYSRRPALGGPKAAHEWWLGEASEPPASPRRLGRKEQALWELVRGGPAKPMSYYASYLKNPLPQAHSLTAKGLTSLAQREVFRDDPSRAIFNETRPAPPPTREQAAALAQIEAALEGRRHHGFLLFGITGSGKTEVYLRAAEKTLAQGREVLWLTPEIALTLGLEGLLKHRLGSEKLAILHSALTPGQRHDQWLRIRRGLAPVTLGARSAVFAPLENLGLVVVD
ncbi:MAG: DEAD/DEAH box helicase family protein, partial [Candidatus Adiutrix sp.]|nr:DEAD/DEAH box helicase family protein [Candidatus Adiutrix sp.]